MLSEVLSGKRDWWVEEGDALTVLSRWPDACVHCCATSPPYFAVRDYGVAGQLGLERLHDCAGWATGSRCGACYVCRMTAVFAEVRRVLRPDGTLWLNVGDCYASKPPGNKDTLSSGLAGAQTSASYAERLLAKDNRGPRPVPAGLKPKDLLGVPWRLALSLQADGWYLRAECIWAKRNPMPESVRDRPTRAHEQVFLFARSARYFYDGEAVRERQTGNAHSRGKGITPKTVERTGLDLVRANRTFHASTSAYHEAPDHCRSLRSVWWLSSESFKGAHFATFPKKLVAPCIRAGTSERGVCPACGAPWVRQVGRRRAPTRPGDTSKAKVPVVEGRGGTVVGNRDPRRHCTTTEATGWAPSCSCGCPGGVLPGDLDLIGTPTGGDGDGHDWRAAGCPRPFRPTGGNGHERPRSADEGVRLITEYERRAYAAQLRDAPEDVRRRMEEEAGREAFAHYRKPGRASGRPLPPDLLERWLACGWLRRAEVPAWEPPAPVPAIVLDPFCGAGTTLLVARRLGRRAVGIDLSPKYCDMARRRIEGDAPLFNRRTPEEPP